MTLTERQIYWYIQIYRIQSLERDLYTSTFKKNALKIGLKDGFIFGTRIKSCTFNGTDGIYDFENHWAIIAGG